MTQSQWTHLIISWLPILIIYVMWIAYTRKGMARQQQMLDLLTEIRDRLPANKI